MFSFLTAVFDSEIRPFPCRELTLDEAISGWKGLSYIVDKLVVAGKRVSMENKILEEKNKVLEEENRVLKEENKVLKEALRKRTAELAESEDMLRSNLEMFS